MTDSRLSCYISRAEDVLVDKYTRRGFIDSIEELVEAYAGTFNENERLAHKAQSLKTENHKLKACVLNYERIISARDRFGCWLCSKHEREGM